MAKTPVTRDRFRIIAETSAENMGPLLAQLTRMGLENIGYELITDVRRFHQNGERKVHATNAVEAVRAFVQENPTFQVSQVVAAFEAAERTGTSAYSAVKILLTNKEIVKLSPGNYQRADVKALAAPQAVKKSKRGQVGRHDVSNETLILKAMKGRKKISLQDMQALLVSHGRSAKSASPILSKFVKQKLIKQIAPGQYEVVQKKTPAPKKPAAKLNGQDQSPAENANG